LPGRRAICGHSHCARHTFWDSKVLAMVHPTRRKRERCVDRDRDRSNKTQRVHWHIEKICAMAHLCGGTTTTTTTTTNMVRGKRWLGKHTGTNYKTHVPKHRHFYSSCRLFVPGFLMVGGHGVFRFNVFYSFLITEIFIHHATNRPTRWTHISGGVTFS
jgi:hypothetical protein